MSVLIVGASISGIGTARLLRSKGFDGPIRVLDEELHLPYDKPPLSKEMLVADGYGEPVALISAEEIEKLELDLTTGARAVELDTDHRTVLLESGESISYETLVIATGAKPRTLAIPTPLGVYTLRTLEDANSIRAELATAAHLVIVGAGFIGAELATAARAQGVHVTIVEAQPVPMSHLFGDEVARSLNALHTESGVKILTDVQVTAFLGDPRVTGLELSDGSTIQADFVVVAIGANPATQWLSTSGLDITNGIACDEQLRALGAEGVYAAGDIAHWPHGLYDSTLRIEHWTNANEHAAIVAASILGLPQPAPQVPYVWSHQYGRMIQIIGQPRRGSLVRTTGDVIAGPSYVALYADSEGKVVGAMCIDSARALMACRRAIKNAAAADDLVLPE